MRLRTLAGAYAGQIRDYGAVAGLAALRSGTAESLDAPRAREPQVPPTSAGAGVETDRPARFARHRAGRK